MKITVTGSLGNIGKVLTEILVKQGHHVTVVSSQPDRKESIETLGAAAAIGSVSDTSFLTTAFAGAEAIFAMTPPNLGGSNIIANTVAAGKSLAKAIENAGVRRVVMLSSIGADLPTGNGPIAGLHHIENLYRQLDGVSVTFLRAGFFYSNYYGNVGMIKGAGILGANYPGTVHIPLVHTNDIATVAAEALQLNASDKQVQYVVSDVRTGADVAAAIGAAIGKPDLPWIEFTDEQSKAGMLQAGLPEEIAGLYTEMGTGFRLGHIAADFEKQGSPVVGKIKLAEFAKEFAGRF